MFTGFHTTDKGHRYMAKAVEGKTLVLTKGQYGNGELQEGTIVTSMTALIAPLADMPISKKSSLDNCMTTTTQFSNKVNGVILSPFYFMEAGIFGKVKNADGTDDEDAPEALLFYTNALTQDKADYIAGILTEFILNWNITISEGTNVTAEIKESMIYPTIEEFNERTPRKVTAEGTEELAVTIDDVPLEDNMHLMIELTNDLSAYATIKYNDGEAYPIYNSNGTDIVEKQQIAGSTLHIAFNDKKKCWYIVGGGSVEIATKTEAEKGTDDTKMMTPQKVAVYVDKILGDVNQILDSINGEVV